MTNLTKLGDHVKKERSKQCFRNAFDILLKRIDGRWLPIVVISKLFHREAAHSLKQWSSYVLLRVTQEDANLNESCLIENHKFLHRYTGDVFLRAPIHLQDFSPGIMRSLLRVRIIS